MLLQGVQCLRCGVPIRVVLPHAKECICYTDYNPRILKGIKRGYQVAAGKIDKELLHRILAAILEDTYDMDEELKLDIFNAIR